MQNNNQVNDDVIEIDLQELFLYMLKRLWIFMACAIIGGALMYVYCSLTSVPMYDSSTTFYVLNSSKETLTSGDLSMNTTLAKDYTQLIKSRTVLERVAQDCDVPSVAGKISVSILQDTRIIRITATDRNPAMAQKIANSAREQASEMIKQVMAIEAVNMIDEANFPVSPIANNTSKMLLLGIAVGFAIPMMIFLVLFLLDDTIKTPDDIERYLGLSTLASIPVIGTDGNKKQGKAHMKKKRKESGRYEADFQQDNTIDDEDIEEIKVDRPADKSGKGEA